MLKNFVKNTIFFFLTFLLPIAAEAIDVTLQKELLEMQERDQNLRLQLATIIWECPEEVLQEIARIDEENGRRLRAIIDSYGWPGISLVGEEGAAAMWLLVQHQDADVEFQKRCLFLLDEAIREDDAPMKHYAYLLDRVNMHEEKPQVYGTQWRQEDGKLAIYCVEDRVNLDAIRYQAGLCPMSEYAEMMKNGYNLQDEDFKEGFLMQFMTIRGKKFYYRDVGQGYPILFGHSYLWNSKMWEPQIEALSKHFRCIVTDLWDHGNSDCLDEEYSLKACAEDHWQLMQHLGLDEFAMVGLSIGGMWGTELTLAHPDAVSALVLMDTFVGGEPSVSQERYFALLDKIESDGCFIPPIVDQVVPIFFSPQTLTCQKPFVEEFRNRLLEMKKEQIPGIVKIGRIIFSREDRLAQLKTISQPTLIITGRDDIPRPPVEAEQMAELLPNSRVKIIENAGHICNLECPEKVNHLLLNFLNKLNERVEL